VSFAVITLYVASERVFIVVNAHFVIESVRKLLDMPSYVTLTYSMGQSPSCGYNSHSASQKIARLNGTRRFITVFTRALHWPLS
jgi:hypothetical protein